MKGTTVVHSALLLLVWGLLLGACTDARPVTDDGRVQGKSDAPLTLIEYSDFTCGYCLKFFQETLPRLQAAYLDTGKVKFVYRDYPRSDRGVGVEAAVAARCAGAQGRYWAMHDRLFGEGRRLDSGSFKRVAKSWDWMRCSLESVSMSGGTWNQFFKTVKRRIDGDFTVHRDLF